jgi:hypothetical protein
MPSGFDKSQFTAIEQYSLKVDWGNGLGVNTYWSEEVKREQVQVSIIDEMSPKVAGKMPHLYKDKECTIQVENADYYDNDDFAIFYYLTADTDGKVTLYAKWEDAL